MKTALLLAKSSWKLKNKPFPQCTTWNETSVSIKNSVNDCRLVYSMKTGIRCECFPLNLTIFFRTGILENISGQSLQSLDVKCSYMGNILPINSDYRQNKHGAYYVRISVIKFKVYRISSNNQQTLNKRIPLINTSPPTNWKFIWNRHADNETMKTTVNSKITKNFMSVVDMYCLTLHKELFFLQMSASLF